MSNVRLTAAALFAVVGLGLACSKTNAAVILSTVGVYDPIAQANQVDRNANGNSIGATGPNDVAGFTVDVANAFSTNNGGVIDFESQTTSLLTGPINAAFGVGGTKSVAITVTTTSSNNFNFQTSANVSPISGSNFFLNSTDATGTDGSRFTFGAITGGALGEVVTRLGFTVVGRSTGNSTNITAIVTYNDSSTATLGPTAFTSDATFASQDTFYGFTAPAGLWIDNVLITASATTDGRRGIDDLAFITSVIPEPSLLALAAFGSIGIICYGWRRKR